MSSGARARWKRYSLEALGFFLGGAAPAIFFAITGRIHSLRGFWYSYLFSQTFALFIGSMTWLSLSRLGSPIGRLTPVWRWTTLVALLLANAGIGAAAAVAFLAVLGWLPWAAYWTSVRESLLMSIMMTLGIGITVFVHEMGKYKVAAANSEAERSRRAATQAKLESLESRIHPHFLFNTLNSISALIREDPARAERLVEQLAALLRFSLDAAGLVPLERELKIVSDYLEIERARFGDRLRYSIDVPAEFHSIEVPPLSIQTLVENAVKHSIAPRREGGAIVVSASHRGGLSIDVTDDGPGFTPDAFIPGHGLDNLQSRLTAIYGAEAKLDVIRLDGESTVRLTLPARAAA